MLRSCITYQHRENQRHNIDGPCRTETGEHGEAEIVPQRGNLLSLLAFQVVGAPVQWGLGGHDRLPSSETLEAERRGTGLGHWKSGGGGEGGESVEQWWWKREISLQRDMRGNQKPEKSEQTEERQTEWILVLHRNRKRTEILRWRDILQSIITSKIYNNLQPF